MRELDFPKTANASNITTNMFESCNGVLNIAPIKISGQYKIVVALDGNLYLDDYNNHRVLIDMSKKFLPQVANFLQIKTDIVDKDNLGYGGFQRLTKKFWHVPLYISHQDNFDEKLPNYFLVNRTLNEEMVEEDLQHYSNAILLADFNKNGINNILTEIKNECNSYPVYFNFQDSTYTIYGYSLTEECWKPVTINTTYSQANQPYIDVFNNNILNAFDNNHLIYPKFINIEFEFSFTDNIVPFNNFYGYVSYGEEIPDVSRKAIEIKIQEYEDYIIWKQILYGEECVLEKYIRPIKTVSTIPITVQAPQVNFRVDTINVNDYFCIKYPDGSVFFDYYVQVKDIFPDSLYKTVVNLCKVMTKNNGMNFKFSVNTNNIVTCKSSIGDIYEEQYSIEIPKFCYILDRYADDENIKDSNYNYFRGITSYDVQLSNVSNITKQGNLLSVNDKYFKIVDTFKFNGSPIIRCIGVDDITDYPEIDAYTQVEFFTIETEKLYRFPEIPFYSVDGDLKASHQFDSDKFISYLMASFPEPENPTELQELQYKSFLKAIEDYKKRIRITIDALPYIKEDDNLMEPVESDTIYQDANNETNINTLMFNSVGSTSMITPNIMNIEKQMYVNNGNTDLNVADTDPLAFHWFLICADNYLLHINEQSGLSNQSHTNENVMSLRYLKPLTRPRITSRIMRVNNDYCETIFLGVKYRLPLRYENYQFSVYYDMNNQLDSEINYKFLVDDNGHELYLRVGYYLDYCDLIRGGNEKNQPIVDLSFLYNVASSYNEQSTFLSGFVTGGIELCDETIPVMFGGKPTTDWKIYSSDEKKHYVCLKNSTTSESVDFRTLFPDVIGESQDFYMYAKINYRGIDYTYISMVIKAKYIREVGENYVWCEDISIRFFDTREMFIQKIVAGSDPVIIDWFNVPITPDRIIHTEDKTTNLFGDYVKTATVRVERVIDGVTVLVPEVFELLLPEKELSLKQNYFEITKTIVPAVGGNGNGTMETHFSSFKFPDFIKPDWGTNDLITQFEIESFDEYSDISRITLFDRNQLWYFIKDYMNYDVRFKYVTEDQIRKSINNLLVSNLKEYCEMKSIPIYQHNGIYDDDNSHKFGYIPLTVVENDYNAVIWNILTNNGRENKLFNINRYKGAYLPYLRKLGIGDSLVECNNGVVDFQKKMYTSNQRLFNIYDPDFAGKNINATGLWDEVKGNVVSSIFCRDEDIKIDIVFSENINIYNLFMDQIKLDEAIINKNRNEDYISKIDENIDQYIIRSYGEYLLKNFYVFDSVKNELGQTLRYTNDTLNKQIIHLQPIGSYQTTFKKLIIIFKRK